MHGGHQHGHGSSVAVQVADGVGAQGCPGKGPDEKNVGIVQQLLVEVLETGVTDETDMVARLLAPHAHSLGHDAGEVRVHHAGVKPACWALRDKVKDGDAEATRSCTLQSHEM